MSERLDGGLPMMEPAVSQNSDADFRPTANWQNLRLRADLLRRVRQFFDDRGFLEVETPLMSADVVVDRHLDPISVVLPDGRHGRKSGGSYGCKHRPNSR